MTWSEAKNSPLHCAAALPSIGCTAPAQCPLANRNAREHGRLLGQRRSSAPDFRLSDVEQTAINQTFAALASTTPTNFGLAARAVNSLRCTSAMRDGQGALGEGRTPDVDPALLADAHAPEVDQTLPHLDGTEKSYVPNICYTLAGTRTEEVRP